MLGSFSKESLGRGEDGRAGEGTGSRQGLSSSQAFPAAESPHPVPSVPCPEVLR